MALLDDIRLQATRLLSREIDLREFEGWLSAESWNVHQAGEPAAETLAYAIELLLSELSGGYRTETQFRNALARLLQDRWAEFVVVEDREPTTQKLVVVNTESVVVSA